MGRSLRPRHAVEVDLNIREQMPFIDQWRARVQPEVVPKNIDQFWIDLPQVIGPRVSGWRFSVAYIVTVVTYV